MTDEVVRILSIDGGGIRGIIPAIVINKLLEKLTAQNTFHIITGTSTGGIIASGLAKPNPMTPQQIVDLYVQKGSSIFKQIDTGAGGPKYNANVLLGYLGEEFEKTRLSDINKSGDTAELLVPSYAIGLPKEKPPGNSCSPMFFRSWQARGFLLEDGATKGEYDFRLSGVARATSAAPIYFSPEPIQNELAEWFTMIDGGVFANNPTMAAIIEAHKLFSATKFQVVSIGTGSEPMKIDVSAAQRWNAPDWLMPLITILLSGSADATDTEVGELLADDYWRFNVSLATALPGGEKLDPAMDNASSTNIEALRAKANQLIEENGQRLADLAELLSKPKDKLQISNTPAPKGILAPAKAVPVA